MKISVIIPVYQRQRTAERALKSALSQGELVHEVVLVDDASPEPFCLPAGLESDSRVRVIRHDTNLGAGEARDTGCRHARGDWIAFLDSDDYWLPGKLAAQAAMAEQDQQKDPGALICYASGYRRILLADGRRHDLVPIESSEAADFASACWFMPGSTVLISKRALDIVGPFDTGLRRLEDLDWYIRFAQAGGRLRVAPVRGAVIEIGPRPARAAVTEACRQLKRKWLNPESPDRLPAASRGRLHAYLDIECAAASLQAGNWLATAFYLARSLVRKPRTQLHLKRWWQTFEAPQTPVSAPGAAHAEKQSI